jgi:hypothetical protein
MLPPELRVAGRGHRRHRAARARLAPARQARGLRPRPAGCRASRSSTSPPSRR